MVSAKKPAAKKKKPAAKKKKPAAKKTKPAAKKTKPAATGATVIRLVAAAFRYDSAIKERTRLVASLAKLPAALKKALERAAGEACREAPARLHLPPGPFVLDGYYAVLGRGRAPVAYAAFAVDRHVNYTLGRYVAVTPEGAPLTSELLVGD